MHKRSQKELSLHQLGSDNIIAPIPSRRYLRAHYSHEEQYVRSRSSRVAFGGGGVPVLEMTNIHKAKSVYKSRKLFHWCHLSYPFSDAFVQLGFKEIVAKQEEPIRGMRKWRNMNMSVQMLHAHISREIRPHKLCFLSLTSVHQGEDTNFGGHSRLNATWTPPLFRNSKERRFS